MYRNCTQSLPKSVKHLPDPRPKTVNHVPEPQCQACTGTAHNLSPRVKSRYPLYTLVPVPALHNRFGSVDASGSAAGVGERAVLFDPVVFDRVLHDDNTVLTDLDFAAHHRDLD
jgi:hypothetical protein